MTGNCCAGGTRKELGARCGSNHPPASSGQYVLRADCVIVGQQQTGFPQLLLTQAVLFRCCRLQVLIQQPHIQLLASCHWQLPHDGCGRQRVAARSSSSRAQQHPPGRIWQQLRRPAAAAGRLAPAPVPAFTLCQWAVTQRPRMGSQRWHRYRVQQQQQPGTAAAPTAAAHRNRRGRQPHAAAGGRHIAARLAQRIKQQLGGGSSSSRHVSIWRLWAVWVYSVSAVAARVGAWAAWYQRQRRQLYARQQRSWQRFWQQSRRGPC